MRAFRRWNAETGNKVRELDNGGPVVALAVRPDSRRIASAGPDFVRLFGDEGGKPIARCKAIRDWRRRFPASTLRSP